MQAHDQDALRRAAQKALTRRIGTDQDERNRPPRQRDRPSEPEPEYSSLEVEPRLMETAALPIDYAEPMARTDRRDVATRPDTAPQTERPAFAVTASRRGDIYRALHSRSSLRQAIILSEILGPPKALRDQDDTSSFGA